MDRKNMLYRVDVQVSLLVAVMVFISCAVLSVFSYMISYRDMHNSIEQRVLPLVKHIEKHLDQRVFSEIKTKADMQKPMYKEAHAFLNDIRSVASIKYLYTVIRDENDVCIYHMDGLNTDHADFRTPGYPLENEFISVLKKSFEDKDIVTSSSIFSTEWGEVFVSYAPLHDPEGKHIGTLGIEFEASSQYKAYRTIRFIAPFIILLTSACAVVVSYILFRRLSNPHFRNVFNTDSVTGLKNRNAYTMDTENHIQTRHIQNCALVLSDLNGLKRINDTQGHAKGDEYIKAFAKALESVEPHDYVVYRIGGDEFATLFFNVEAEKVKTYMNAVKILLQELCKNNIVCPSAALGYAICSDSTVEAWEQTQKEADAAMYEDKRRFYSENKRHDNREA